MSTLREAIDKFPIVEWASNHIPIRDSGSTNVRADCPVCGGKKTLSISRDKKIARCFRCDEGQHGGMVWEGRADLIRFIMLLTNSSRGEAIRTVLENTGIVLTTKHTVDKDYELPEEAMLISSACSEDHPVRKYLSSRGLSNISRWAYVCVGGEHSGRVVLPVEMFGEQVGWEAKAYIDIKPKSISNVKKGSLYFGKVWGSIPAAIIVESIFDAETVPYNAVALLGSYMDADQFTNLHKFIQQNEIENLVWMLDGDAKKKQKALINRWGFTLSKHNFWCDVPEGEDPNSLGQEKIKELLIKAKEIKSAEDLCLF